MTQEKYINILRNSYNYDDDLIQQKLAELYPKHFRPLGDDVVNEDELNRVCKIVFALDPITQNPISDISYIISSGDEGFKEYVKNLLFKDNPQGSVADNPEDAEAVVYKNMMSYKEYESAQRDYVIKQNNLEDVADNQ